MSQLVKVGDLSFVQLFSETDFPLAVDTYQRGFVWNDEKINQLADDLAEYEALPDPKPPYYMGTLLLHRHADRQKCFVIDGQQRLTALCVLHHQLVRKLPDNCELTYSPASARRVGKANELFSKKMHALTNSILERIAFTVIWVERVDLAFTFFDTQNNRGVRLHATDLLKAYHLRAVDDDSAERKEALQTLCAKRWEGIQQGTPVLSHDAEFAPSLFSKFLWRARRWTGNQVVYGGHDALIHEFQQQAWPLDGDSATIPLYGSRHNRLGQALHLNREGHSEIVGHRISLSPSAEDLPFAIRQPIHSGVSFFLYADKYAALLRRLMTEPTDCQELIRFREVYNQLLMASSRYLREVFLLSSLVYVDQFGTARLWEFALWLEHALGAIRVNKQQVRYEAAQNFFKTHEHNLLDVIAGGFHSKQVITHLREHHAHTETYRSEQIKTGEGVQGRYKKAVLSYYGHPEKHSLREKTDWIAMKVQGCTA